MNQTTLLRLALLGFTFTSLFINGVSNQTGPLSQSTEEAAYPILVSINIPAELDLKMQQHEFFADFANGFQAYIDESQSQPYDKNLHITLKLVCVSDHSDDSIEIVAEAPMLEHATVLNVKIANELRAGLNQATEQGASAARSLRQLLRKIYLDTEPPCQALPGVPTIKTSWIQQTNTRAKKKQQFTRKKKRPSKCPHAGMVETTNIFDVPPGSVYLMSSRQEGNRVVIVFRYWSCSGKPPAKKKATGGQKNHFDVVEPRTACLRPGVNHTANSHRAPKLLGARFLFMQTIKNLIFHYIDILIYICYNCKS